MGKWPRGNQEKVWPLRALSTCFLMAKCFEQVHKREEKAGLYFSFLFHSLPALRSQQGCSPASPRPPGSLTRWVSPSVCPAFSLAPFDPSLPSAFSLFLFWSPPAPLGLDPSFLDPEFQPGFRPCWPNTFSSLCPGQPGQSGLIFNPCFRLTQ